MPQLSLRLVHPLRRPPEGPARGPSPVGHPYTSPPVSARVARIEQLRALVGSRGRVGILPPPPDPTAVATVLDPGCLSTGIAGLDAWLQGWPRPGPTEIAGPAGAGRLALVVPLLELLTRQGRTVLLVDPQHQVHPPGLGKVELARVVLVRPPPERASWVAEQVARSGSVDALVLIDAPPLGRGGVRLARAAEAGNMAVFVLSERPEVELPASLRLEVEGWQADRVHVQCTRSRDGRRVGARDIAPAERSASPRVSIGSSAASLRPLLRARGGT